MLNSLSYHII